LQPKARSAAAPAPFAAQPAQGVLQRKAALAQRPVGQPHGASGAQQGAMIRAPHRPKMPAVSTQVVQMLAEHAATYSEKNNLGLKTTKKKKGLYGKKTATVVSYVDVKAFVENPDNDSKHRRGLCEAWNKGKQSLRIPMPDELKPKVVTKFNEGGFNFLDYDSSDDDEMDIEQTMNENKSQMVTIRRDDGTEVEVFVFGLGEAIKIGRQIVKREKIKKKGLLPMVARSGEHFVEFHHPGTLDIYSFPLVKQVEGEKVYFKRGGNTKSFKWTTLGTGLEKELPSENESGERKAKRQRIFGPFHGRDPEQVTSGEFGASCAIGSDWMKGSGNKTFIKKVIDDYEVDISFNDLFGGKSPKYEPAGSGGRSQVTEETKRLKSIKRKIGEI
jgi:hypothetical protein